MTRTVVLLGAGASFDAGLPLTSQLAERLVARFNDTSPASPETLTLNFIYSAMVGHQGEDGSNPLRAVNVETLISAVRLLRSRESHEVAPFVSSWKTGALGFPIPIENTYGGSLADAVNEAVHSNYSSGGDMLAAQIIDIATDVVNASDGSSFRSLESALLLAIQEELSPLRSVTYLRPLADLARAQQGGLDVLTLNYDLTIETMAAKVRLPIDRGIERWVPGTPMQFERADGQINLYKMHGSLDWELVEGGHGRNSPYPPTIRPLVPEGDADVSGRSGRPPRVPWIVVGDREKLATEGPTLDLLNAATHALNSADRLLVVGYSFADDHINVMVRNWMAGREDRTLVVVDPVWSSSGAGYAIAGAYGGPEDVAQPGERRTAVVRRSAAEGLSEAIDTFPARIDVWATADWGPDADEVIIKLVGPRLFNLVVGSPGNVTAVFASQAERDEEPDPRRSRWNTPKASFGTVESGTELSVYVVVPTDRRDLGLEITATDYVGKRVIRLPRLKMHESPDRSVLIDDS